MIGFYKIADMIVRVESMYEDVHEYCRDYVCEETSPDIDIVITPDDLLYERKKSEAEAAISPKSTHTALWRKHLGDRAKMVNDDKPLIRVTKDGAFVYGTPWNGKHRLGSNIRVPLKGLCILSRGEKNEIKRIERKDAFPMLLQQAYRPSDIKALDKTVKLLTQLTENVALFRLKCNMDIEAAKVAFDYMSGISGESRK